MYVRNIGETLKHPTRLPPEGFISFDLSSGLVMGDAHDAYSLHCGSFMELSCLLITGS